MPILAKGTLKIAEKCGVATAIFLRGQGDNESLAFKQMKEEEMAEWVNCNVEPLHDRESKLFRCSATLTDGLVLPCVIVRNKQNWTKLAIKRFEDCRKYRGEKNMLYDYPTIVENFSCSGNRINHYEIKTLQHSPYAFPVERMGEILGETSMSWTQFSVKMKDNVEFEFGTSFHTEFFNMPDGYSSQDIVKIIPAQRGIPRIGMLNSFEKNLSSIAS